VKWEPHFEGLQGFGSFWQSLIPQVLLEEDSDDERPLIIDEQEDSDASVMEVPSVTIVFPREPLPKQPSPLRAIRKQKSPKTPNPWCVKPVGGWRAPVIRFINGMPHYTVRHKRACACTDFSPLTTRQPEVYTLHLRAGYSHFVRIDQATGALQRPTLTAPGTRSREVQTSLTCAHGERSLLIHY
jgi:hypothetical protein